MSSRIWLGGVISAATLCVPFLTTELAVQPLAAAPFASVDRQEPQEHVVEEIVAKVNGQIITRGEIEKQQQEIEAELRQQGLTGVGVQTALKQRMADVLRNQIDQLLLVEKGKELNINVDADVNKRIAEIQSESKVSDPEKFHAWLQDQLHGVSFEDFKDQMKNQMLTQRVISEEVYRNVNIPKGDIEKYYNEHKNEFVRQEMVELREILISTGDNTPDKVSDAEKKAKNLVDRLRKGEVKFAEMARQYSDAPTATSDGDLGSFKKGDLAKDVEDVVFKQQKGYVTDPIRRPAGFEIYRVEEHYAAGQATLDEVQNDIVNKLMEPRVGPKVREYLTQLRQNAYLQIKSGYIDSGAAPGKDTTWQDAETLRPETTTKENVAARAHKKFLHVIPYGHVGDKPTNDSSAPASDSAPAQTPAAAPAPAVAPVPAAAPVPVAPTSK